MDPKKYKKATAGVPIKIGPPDNEYWAFVPNALPPKLRLSTELFSILSEADRALGGLAGLGRTIINPHILINPFLRREAVLSSRIEGTQADISDLYAYQAGQPSASPLIDVEGKKPASKDDVQEVSNYVYALEYGIERLKTLPVSKRFINELHDHLMQGVRGETATPGKFRTTQNWIGRRKSSLQEADYVPPPPTEMQKNLDDLEVYINNQDIGYPPLIKVALIHYQFEAIHPYRDGNGRIGRLLISLLLVDWKLLPLPLLYLSAYFEKNRNQYIDLLQAVSEQGRWNDWLLFFLQGVIEESRDASKRVKQLQDLQLKWRAQLQDEQIRASILAFKVVDYLFYMPVITTNQIQKEMGVSHAGASRVISRLVNMQILAEISSSKRSKLYVARQVMAIIS